MTTRPDTGAILHGPAPTNEIPFVTLPEFIRGHEPQHIDALTSDRPSHEPRPSCFTAMHALRVSIGAPFQSPRKSFTTAFVLSEIRFPKIVRQQLARIANFCHPC